MLMFWHTGQVLDYILIPLVLSSPVAEKTELAGLNIVFEMLGTPGIFGFLSQPTQDS